MRSYDEIAQQAKAYANYTSDQLEEMDREMLSEQLSLRLVAVEELKSSKRAIAQSTNELLKRVNGDILAINREIRKRSVEASEERRSDRGEVIINALPEPAELIRVS